MIKIQRISVKGQIETDVLLPNIISLEKFRKQLIESYQCNEPKSKFDISFVIQTDNFTDIKYPK